MIDNTTCRALITTAVKIQYQVHGACLPCTEVSAHLNLRYHIGHILQYCKCILTTVGISEVWKNFYTAYDINLLSFSRCRSISNYLDVLVKLIAELRRIAYSYKDVLHFVDVIIECAGRKLQIMYPNTISKCLESN